MMEANRRTEFDVAFVCHQVTTVVADAPQQLLQKRQHAAMKDRLHESDMPEMARTRYVVASTFFAAVTRPRRHA
jgi:hypothetical protein